MLSCRQQHLKYNNNNNNSIEFTALVRGLVHRTQSLHLQSHKSLFHHFITIAQNFIWFFPENMAVYGTQRTTHTHTHEMVFLGQEKSIGSKPLTVRRQCDANSHSLENCKESLETPDSTIQVVAAKSL